MVSKLAYNISKMSKYYFWRLFIESKKEMCSMFNGMKLCLAQTQWDTNKQYDRINNVIIQLTQLSTSVYCILYIIHTIIDVRLHV